MGFYEELGFRDKKEMLELVAKVDLSNNENFNNFLSWKHNDGTKKGLMELL